MKSFSRRFVLFLLLCPFLPLQAFSSEDAVQDEPSIFTPEQLSALTCDEDHLIGGVISPLSGNPCLHQTDFTAQGAQEISLKRIYVSPYMPHLFNNHWDADCYFRRRYLIRHYEGWKSLPHLHLWFDADKQEIHLIDSNAAAYDFNISGLKPKLLNAFAVSNLGNDETPSGKFDPRNTRISYKNSCFTINSPDGFTRFYQHKKGSIFLLEKEILPSGKVLKYHYTDAGRLSLIESLDPKEHYVYASVRVENSPLDGKLSVFSSTGLNAVYTFDNQHVEGKFRQGRIKTKYKCTLPPLLTAVNSPQYSWEVSTHTSPNCLLESFSGKDEVFTLNYASFGEGDKAHLRVDKLRLPVGPNDSLIPVYEMSYQPAVAGEKSGSTTVKNCNGTSTVFYFSKNLLTTSIQYFGNDGILKKEKVFSWSGKNWLTSIELRDGNQQLLLRKCYEYDDFGNPITETLIGDLQGNGRIDQYHIKREFSQDGRNLILKEETDDGKITTFEYLPKTNLVTLKTTKSKDRVFIRESFQYDECNNLIQTCIDDGNSHKRITNYILRQKQPFLHMPEWIEEKYLEKGQEKLLKRKALTYDQWGNVIEEKIYDANGHYAYSILKEYNERGDLLSETNPLGQKRTFAYDSRGRCIEETNFSQNLREEMKYDTQGRLVEEKAIGKDGIHTSSYQYDSNDNLTQKIDTYGNVFQYAYDPLVQKVTRTDSPSILTIDGQSAPVVTSSAYDPWGREISTTDANGNSTYYRYNAYGSLIEITYPNGSKECSHYTKSGKIASHTDQEGLIMAYAHDVLGRVISQAYGNCGTKYFAYDSFRLIEESDLEGNITHYLYDRAGRKIQEEKCGRAIKYGYNSLDQLSTITKDSLVTHYKRDLEDRILEKSKTDENGTFLYKINYSYNQDGDVASIIRYINGKEATSNFSYDSFRRKTAHQDPLGYQIQTFYNENNINDLGQKVLQVSTIDSKGITTIETQDPYSRIVKEETRNAQGTIASRDNVYDPKGNTILWKEHIYQDGHYQKTQSTHFTYTSEDQIEGIIRAFDTPNARSNQYTYTPGGKIATKTLSDGTTLFYDYHPLGYLQRLSSSDEKTLHHFEYNKNGDLLYAFDEVENIAIQREVDPFGNVTRETFPYTEVIKEYDPFDRVKKLCIKNYGHVAYTYDPLNLKEVSRFSQDDNLQYTHRYVEYDLDGNLLTENMPYDSGTIKHKLDLKGRKEKISSPYFSQRCMYDCDNLLESTIDQTFITYTYDDLSQLTSENENTYRYDSLYNRTKKNKIYFQINDLNELKSHSYDLNGNLIQKNDIHYTYDPLNRLREAAIGTKTIQFQYDPLGRCLTKIVIDQGQSYHEHYLYDGRNEIGAFLLDGTLKDFKVIGTQPVALELNAHIFAPVLDMQGNICKLVDPQSKTVISEYEFSAFGEQKELKDGNPWRYATKRFDQDLEIIDFGKRYYDPELGRWLTNDPAGFADSLNLYQYAFNNPFRYGDFDGQFVIAIPFLIWGAAEIILPSLTAYATAVMYSAITSAFVYGGYKAVQAFEKRSSRPDPDSHAEGSPHTIIQIPGSAGSYTTHNGDGTYKQYRGSGKPHGNIPRPNIKETQNNPSPSGPRPGKPKVRKPRPDEIPKGN